MPATSHSVKDDYLDNRVATAYDAERFASFSGRTFDRLEKQAIRRALKFVLHRLPSPRVLDVPCGTGRITSFMLEQGLRVRGADISPAMIDQARQKCAPYGDLETSIIDLERPEECQPVCDLAVCIRLLHHLSSDRRQIILASLSRLSAAYVIVNVSFSSVYYRLRRRLKRLLRQGVSRESSTWREIERECTYANLRVAGSFFVAPLLSEDLILVLEKCP